MYNTISANPDIKSAVSWVDGAGHKIGDVAVNLGSDVQNAMGTAWDGLKGAGSSFVSGVSSFGNSIADGASSAWHAVEDSGY